MKEKILNMIKKNLKNLYLMIIEYTRILICDTIKPTEQVYIAVDGPAPRAKVVQQRSRRFKGIQEKKIMDKLKKYNIDNNEKWNASANMSPGTAFMFKLTKRLSKEKKGTFSKNNPDLYPY